MSARYDTAPTTPLVIPSMAVPTPSVGPVMGVPKPHVFTVDQISFLYPLLARVEALEALQRQAAAIHQHKREEVVRDPKIDAARDAEVDAMVDTIKTKVLPLARAQADVWHGIVVAVLLSLSAFFAIFSVCGCIDEVKGHAIFQPTRIAVLQGVVAVV